MIEMKRQHLLTRTGQCDARFAQLLRWVVLTTLLLCTLPTAFAQLTTADIVGTVTDSTGAVIPNANITVVNIDTHSQRAGTSNGSGDFQFTLLPVGRYSVAVKAAGFKTANTATLAVEAGDRARADIHMEIGGESETVMVEAQTPLLQADNATVSSTVTAQSVQDLPLNGRNFVQLVQLVPGANEGPGNGLTSGGRPDDRRSTSGFSVNGQDDTLNNYVIDGIDNNERIIGSIGVKPNVEGIQEITVQTNSYAPEAGRTAGGVINIVTRSGTNQFHGSAYEFFRNDIFDARNVLQTNGAKPELRQNQFGGSIGGPIFKDRTFFFFDYEGLRLVSGVTYTKTVPTLAEYNDINSIGPGNNPQALVAAGKGTAAFPINPIALNYLKLFPAPNVGSVGQLTNNFTISPNKTQTSNTYDARVDHRLNGQNQLFARFSYNTVNTFTPPGLGTVNGLQISGGRYDFAGPAIDVAQQYALGYTHIFTPNLLADLRAGFTRINNLSLPLNYGKGANTAVGFPASHTFSPFADSLTPVSVGPFSDLGDGAYVPLQDIDNTFQYLATISWTKGSHNIKAGASFIRRQARNVQSASAAGAYGFGLASDNNSDQLTQQNNQLASTLVGAFQNDTRQFDLNPPDYRSYEPSGFVQDSWKVNPKLTLVYGGRYDVFTPFTEAHNRISNFDYLQALSSNGSNVTSALKIANVNGVDGHANIPTDYSNFAPRLGFSMSLTPAIVLRGGYGLSFFPGNYTSNADLKNAPFVANFSPNCQSSLAIQIEGSQGVDLSGQNKSCSLVGGAPTNLSQGLPIPVAPNVSDIRLIPGLAFTAEAPKFRSALIQQFNLQLEQQFGSNVLTIGYVGNIGQHLPESINNINQPKPFNPVTNSAGSARPLDAVFLNPANPALGSNLGSVSYLQSEGVSNYSALQVSLQRRFTKGLAFDANYTWGKGLSDITGFSQQGGNQGWSNADPTRIRQIEYGIAENDIQNRFALSLNYALQYGKNFTGVKKFALGGWQANTIVVWQSGKPFTITNTGSGVDNPEGLGYNNRSTPLNSGGQDRPNQVGDARSAHKTNTQFFNTAAFVPQPLGTVGNTQRNSLFGPNFRHVDLSLFKDFPLTERAKVQFRAESFNISNTPNFYIGNGSSGASFGNTSFGSISQTDPNYVPRQYQFALKLQF